MPNSGKTAARPKLQHVDIILGAQHKHYPTPNTTTTLHTRGITWATGSQDQKKKKKKTNTLDTVYPILTLSDSSQIRGVDAIWQYNNKCHQENRSRSLGGSDLGQN
jgi:hypothetical protein